LGGDDGTSWLHRLSPIVKLAWLAAGVCFAFATYHPGPLLVVCGLGVAAAASAGVLAPLIRIVLAFGPLAASILVVQALAPVSCDPACTEVASLGRLTIYAEGVARGLSLVARILAMEIVAFTVLLTTHPSDLFGALERLRVPRSVAFAASMTLQLVPILEREVTLVLAAQRARGLSARGPLAVARAVVPVVVASVERAQHLALSLESRGFGAPGPRTSYRGVELTGVGRMLALAGVAVGVAATVTGLLWWGPGPGAWVAVPPVLAVTLVALAAVVFVGVVMRALVLVLRA